jgi:glycosyltransferase involved in cell wall biosynthesis
MNPNTTLTSDTDLPIQVYAIFDMAGKEDDYKAFSYLSRLNESLENRATIEARILGPYRGPRLNKPHLKARSFRSLNIPPYEKRFGHFFKFLRKKFKSVPTYYWFSSLEDKHCSTLKWMKKWIRPYAKAVYFVQDLDAGLKLVELTFLYAKNVPIGIVVVLLGTQLFNAQKLQRLAGWGVHILLDGSDYSALTHSSLQFYPSLRFDSVQEMPLRLSSVPYVNWDEELKKANLLLRNPEKVLFVRPDWMKCGSATTFSKLGKLFQDRGAILIDVALQPYRMPYDKVVVERKLAEVESDISPSFHFNLRCASRMYSWLAIAIGCLQTWPKTVAGFMPIFYGRCITPSVVRKLINDADIDYVYVNHYFSLPVAKRLCDNRPFFLDTHDIQSLNFVAHEYHRHINMRAAPFSACLQEELRIFDQADRVTMVSRDEIELVNKYRPRDNFFYYIPIPSLPDSSQIEDKQGYENENNTAVKLLIIASRNPANERSLSWFLNRIWPSVIKTGASLEIVGSISKSFSDNSFENVTFLGMVDNVTEAYQRADVVVLPITNGGGIAIKTLEAVQFGKPIVATRHAMRGLPLSIGNVMPGWLAEEDLVSDLSRLINSREAREQRIEQVHKLQNILSSMRFDEHMHAELDLMRAARKQELPKGIERIGRCIIVTPASPGSKGDEGMLRGCLSVLMGSSLVVLNPEQSPLWSETISDEESVFREQAGPFSEFHNSITQNDALIFLGADVIDGTCGLEPSLQRINLMKAALRVGAKVHVFCSFRSNVDKTIVAQLKQMQGVNFYLRDLHSLNHFKDQTNLEAEYFPDFFIFCSKKETAQCHDARKTLAKARAAGKMLVGLNFSEHAFRSFYDTHDFEHRKKYVADVLTCLTHSIDNPHFLLISHDVRHWENFPPDSEYQDIAYDWLKAAGYSHCTSFMNPGITYPEILSLLDVLNVVVSGRMHLALAAFRNHVIPICFMGVGKGYSSVDKMRGTFDKFIGQTELVPSSTIELISAVNMLLKKYDLLRERLNESLLVIEKESIEKKIWFRKKLQIRDKRGVAMPR